MHSPPLQLQPISTTHYYVSGDVIIHAGAAIAPGVLLQADPGSQIVIGVGVCLGVGCVVHARQGRILLYEGAMIGAGVLLVGQVTVGARACIGSATTIFDDEIAPDAMIAPGSLLGDRSRTLNGFSVTELSAAASPPFAASPAANETQAEPASPSPPTDVSPATEPPLDPTTPSAEGVESDGGNVYGQVYVNQLLVKLFPHKQAIEPPATGENA
jgi:carbon dioxide concentrating mechanism protein CcmN